MASLASFLVTFCRFLLLETSPDIGWCTLQSTNAALFQHDGRQGTQPIVNVLFLSLHPRFFGTVAFALVFAHAHLHVKNRWEGGDNVTG
jgi:hypothetical protein